VPHDLRENAEGRLRLHAEVEQLRARGVRTANVVVTHDEVNDRHGTGVLVQRLVAGRDDVLSIRGQDHYGGEHVLGRAQLAVPPSLTDRADIYRWTLGAMRGIEVGWILCVPLGPPEIAVALALRDAHSVPLCLYLMDDQNLEGHDIPDELMSEAIDKATVRFAISSDMRGAYEAKYGRRFWILPPTLPPGVIPGRPRPTGHDRGVVVGNIWGRGWLEALRETVREAGLEVDWYPNAPRGGWLDVDPAELAVDGLRLLEPLPAFDLARRLRDYEFALMPSAPRLGGPESHAVAALSLPSRLATVVGATELPIVVLGDADTCAARFVSFFDLGVSCSYGGRELRDAVEGFRGDGPRAALDEAVGRMRRLLHVDDLGGWIERAIVGGRPPTLHFEELEVHPLLHAPHYGEEAPGLGPWLWGFETLNASLSRLSALGWQPSFVIDGGSSSGVWSDIVARHFPLARFVLVDPLEDRYDGGAREVFRERLPDAVHVQAALGARSGTGTLHVEDQLYGSSLRPEHVPDAASTLTVPVTTLDQVARDAGLTPGGMLKLDIQGAELEAIEGGERVLADLADVVVIEVTLDPPGEEAPSWSQIDRRLGDLGFVAWDQAGEWRDPRTGRLHQMDLIYMRRDTLKSLHPPVPSTEA
jgi:FkbM family methyltransferase